MSILDSIRKIRLKGAKESEAPLDRTVEQILTNDQESALFGNMLANSGLAEDKDLAESIEKKDLSPDQLKLLNERRAQFVEKLRAAEDVKKMLSPDFMSAVVKFAGKDSDFAQMVANNGGSEASSNLFRNQIYDLAFNHPDHFDRIAEAVENRREHHKAVDERVKKVVAKYGFTTKRYGEIMGLGNSQQIHQALRTEIRQNLGGMGRFWEKITGGLYSKNKADLLFTRELDALNPEETRDTQHIENIGSVLAGVVQDNDEMRSVFNHALVSETLELSRGAAFAALKTVSQESLEEDWKKVRPRNFDTFPEDDKLQRRAEFALEWEKKARTRLASATGTWGAIANAKLDALDPMNNLERLV